MYYEDHNIPEQELEENRDPSDGDFGDNHFLDDDSSKYSEDDFGEYIPNEE